MHILLELHGTTSLFHVRTPTDDEVRSDRDCIHVHMTSEAQWDPYNETFCNDECSLRLSLSPEARTRGQQVHAMSTDSHNVVFDLSVLEHQELAAVDIMSCIASATTTRRKGFVSPEQLSK